MARGKLVWKHHYSGGGGELTLESGMGMCHGHDPFFFSGQSALLSLPIYHQCTAHVPPFSILEKFCIVKPCFGQNFSSQDENFQFFCSQDPSFFKENLLRRPYCWNPCGTHLPKKSWVPSPALFASFLLNSSSILWLCLGYVSQE